MQTRSLFILLLSAAAHAGCSSSAKQSSKDSGGGAGAANTTDATAAADTTTAATSDDFANGYFTGFDGTDKFSVYLPSYRPMTIVDSTVAKLENISVTLSSATIDSLVQEEQAKNTKFDATKLRTMLGRTRTVQKLTPLKAGETKLKTKGGGKGPGGNAWSTGDSVALVVTAYTAAQVASGKNRYTRDGDGNKRPCASCHDTGESGAPSHQLGTIMSISDKAAEQWITTGKLEDRVASIQHTWEFDSDAEELGTVAYLRTLQTDDIETLTKMEFENQVANMPPPPDGGGTPAATATTPATN